MTDEPEKKRPPRPFRDLCDEASREQGKVLAALARALRVGVRLKNWNAVLAVIGSLQAIALAMDPAEVFDDDA